MTLLVLGKALFIPKPEKMTVSNFNFPEQVPLTQWELRKTLSLPEPTKVNFKLISQKHYQYVQNNQQLNIEMRYLAEENVRLFIQEFTSNVSYTAVRHQEGVGYYGLGFDKNQAYLSACINPYGNATFTEAQFNQNRLLYEMQPQNLLSSSLGQKQLEHKRCIWAHLSVPLENSSPQTAYQVLENAWFAWYQWWQTRFPKP
jgi:cyanosortase A-associated protein